MFEKNIGILEDVDFESEYSKLDKIEVAVNNSDNEIYVKFLNDNGIDTESLGSSLKSMWVRFKKLMKQVVNITKKLWLKALVSFSRSEERINEYKKKLNNKVILEISKKGEMKEVIKSNYMEFSYGFPSIKTTVPEDIFDNDNKMEMDIIKNLKKPSKETIDVFNDKSDVTFISFKIDTIMFIVSTKKNIEPSYVKVYKEMVDKRYESNLLEVLDKKVDDDNLLKEINQLFDNLRPYSELKKIINDGFKRLSDIDKATERLVNGKETSLAKSTKEYYSLKAYSKYIYVGINELIRQNKLALRVGKIIFD